MPRTSSMSRLGAILTLAGALALPAQASDPAMLRLAAPASNFAIGVDVQALMLSPLAQEAMLKAQAENPTWGQALSALGPNPLGRIQEVLIVGDIDAAREQQQGLVLVRGDFGADDWISMVCQSGCSEENYQGFTMRGVPSADTPGSFVRLDSSYVALGTPQEVRGVIDRRMSGGSSSFASSMNSWTSTTRGHHLWVSAKGPFKTPEAGAAPIPMNALSSLDAFGLGMTLGTDLKVGLEMRSQSDEDSLALHQMLQSVTMMMSMNSEQDPDTAELLRNLHISQAARTVTASLRVPAYLLERMAEERAATVTSGVGVAPAHPAPRPQRARQGIIRIDGLDGGPVEIESEPSPQ